jgi:putative hydrolase of the HAD superfamily
MRKIRAIIFDRDNTLLHVEPTRLRALHEYLSSLAPELSVAEVQLLWETWSGAWPRTVAEEPAFWLSFWTAVGQAHGLSPVLVNTFAESFGSRYATMFQAYPDAAPALRALRRAGFRLAVLTNFELPSIDRTLAQAGLDPGLFELLLSRGTLGVAKPDPRAFMAAADMLGLRPEECCLVDDLSEHVVAARELGMHAFQIDRSGGGAPYAAGSVRSLEQVAHACIQLNSTAGLANERGM